MLQEEQLRVIEALTPALSDKQEDVRKQALHAMIGYGPDGLGRLVDLIEDSTRDTICKRDAIHAIGYAFSEGKVEKTGIVKSAIKALEKSLEKEELRCEAVDALGEIGPQAVSAKPKLFALLDGKQNNNLLCVKISEALLKISPIIR